ncbi:MAG: zinc-ribbon domain-containing protein [Acidimicrobiia bacterium]|nr:zinc-ribbon domain-containing protein [Acidimicrobiia bacterium]
MDTVVSFRAIGGIGANLTTWCEMHCTSCQHKNSDSARFCEQCGESLGHGAVPVDDITHPRVDA